MGQDIKRKLSVYFCLGLLDVHASSMLFVYVVVSCGALGNLSDAMTLMSDVPKLVRTKNDQLEEFCSYRVILSSTLVT